MAEVKPVDEVHSTGHIGSLDSDQKEKLKQIWKEFLDHTKDEGGKAAIAAANGLESQAKELPAKGGSENDASNKGKAKEAAKDDADKASANKAEEQRGLEELLHEHGPGKFHIAFWQYTMGEDPDSLMLRFLRARSWDVQQAFAMLASTVKWRIDTDVEAIVAGGEEELCKQEGIKRNLSLAKCYYHGTDKQNRPVIYVRVKYHKASGQTADEMLKYIVLNMETARNLIPAGSDVETSSVVFDMTGLSLGNVDWDTAPMVIKIFQSHYPETLGHAVVYNAPGIFSAVWKIVKPMLDPAVREKVHFASSASEMGKFIDPKHLEKDFGGSSSWRYRYKGPVAGENKEKEDTETKEKRIEQYSEAVSKWTEATQKWIQGDDAAFKERREKLSKLVRIRQLDLDPYVRGKTIATRDGTVVGDGTVLWHYDHGHNEEFGESADDWAKELSVEDPPARPRHKDEEDVVLSSAEDTVSSTSDSENEILDDPHHHHHNAVAVGFVKFGDNVGNAFSKLGKGPSLHQKRKMKREKKHEEHEARRAKKIELKKKRLEAEREKEEEAEDARLEREEKEREEIENSYQSYLARMANLSLTATNKAADYVPAVLGGNYIKSFTDTHGNAQQEQATA